MPFLFGGGSPEPPPPPIPPPPAPDQSGAGIQEAIAGERRRASLATGRSKMLLVPAEQNQNAAPTRQKMLLGA